MCDHVYCFQKKSAVYAAIVNFQSIIEKTVQKLPWILMEWTKYEGKLMTENK